MNEAVFNTVTLIRIPINKETSTIYSDDKDLLNCNIRYIIQQINREIAHCGFATIAGLFDGLGIHVTREMATMLIENTLDNTVFENGILSITCTSCKTIELNSQKLQRYK